MDMPLRRREIQRKVQKDMRELSDKSTIAKVRGDLKAARTCQILYQRTVSVYNDLDVPQPAEYLLQDVNGKVAYDKIEEMEAEHHLIKPLTYEPRDGHICSDLEWYERTVKEHRRALYKLIRSLRETSDDEGIENIIGEYQDAIPRSTSELQRKRRSADLETIMKALSKPLIEKG